LRTARFRQRFFHVIASGTSAAKPDGMNKISRYVFGIAALASTLVFGGCASNMDEDLKNDDETAAKEAYTRSEAMKENHDVTPTSNCWVGWNTCCYSGYCCSWWFGGSPTCTYKVL